MTKRSQKLFLGAIVVDVVVDVVAAFVAGNDVADVVEVTAVEKFLRPTFEREFSRRWEISRLKNKSIAFNQKFRLS